MKRFALTILLGSLLVGSSAPDHAAPQRLAESAGAPFVLMPEREPQHPFEALHYPFLADETGASVSLGDVTSGYLVNAAELALPSEHYGVLPIQYARGLLYSTEDLNRLLTEAAAVVAERFPGTSTWFGNFGRRQGGDIAWSVSHNSGRDADVAFFLVDAEGNPAMPPDLLPVADDLTCATEAGTLYFDVPRNWAYVEHLLTSDAVQVQFLFISNGLKAVLLDYAEEQGASRDLLRRARTVMTQPGRSNPHNDHLHVRIYCSRLDVERGCENSGRTHDWVRLYRDQRRARVRAVREHLENEEPEQRARAIERLTIMEERRAVGYIAELLADPSPRVRAAAAAAIGSMGTRNDVDELTDAWSTERDPVVVTALTSALASVGGNDAGRYLVSALATPFSLTIEGERVDGRVLVVDALAEMGFADAVGVLIDLLEGHDPLLRARVDWALRRLTNVAIGSDWGDPTIDRSTRVPWIAKWRDWYASWQPVSRRGWLERGYRRSGARMADPEAPLDAGAIAAIVADADAHVSYNAQRRLAVDLRDSAPSLTWSLSDAAWHWRRAARR